MSLTFRCQPKESCITMFEPKALPSRCRRFLASTMWHTVEFSRFGRAPLPACLGGFGATLISYSPVICLSNRYSRDLDRIKSHSGNPTNLPEVPRPVKLCFQCLLWTLVPQGSQSYITLGALATAMISALGAVLGASLGLLQSYEKRFLRWQQDETLRAWLTQVKSTVFRACRVSEYSKNAW